MLIKKINGRKYIHIPKKDWVKKLVKSTLEVERIRGRGRNWESINQHEDEMILKYPNSYRKGFLKRSLSRDGHVPLKYASYLYVKLK